MRTSPHASRINIRTQVLIVVGSIALLVIKMIAYFLTSSVAILTDALESIDRKSVV